MLLCFKAVILAAALDEVVSIELSSLVGTSRREEASL